MSILESIGDAIKAPIQLVENAVNTAVSAPSQLLDSLTENITGNASGDTSGGILTNLSQAISAMRGENESEGTRR